MTTKIRNLPKASLHERVSAEEWEVRVNLAAPEWKAHLRMLDKMDPSYKI